MARYLLSTDPTALSATLDASGAGYGTVEAEFGDLLVAGSRPEWTLAHHGPRSGALAPCLAENIPHPGAQCDPAHCAIVADPWADGAHCSAPCVHPAVVGLSHIDLDTVGGCMALCGAKPADWPAQLFWRAAAWIDTRGPHRIGEWADMTARGQDVTQAEQGEQGAEYYPDPRQTVRQLHAFWAWSRKPENRAPRCAPGQTVDVTDLMIRAIATIWRILHGNAELLAAGDALAADNDRREKGSFIRVEGPVLVRSADEFVNDCYTHDGATFAAVAARNSETGAITLSLGEPIEGVNCCAIVQSLWGPLAGGHAGIAGSPRGESMPSEEFDRAAAALATEIARVENGR